MVYRMTRVTDKFLQNMSRGFYRGDSFKAIEINILYILKNVEIALIITLI